MFPTPVGHSRFVPTFHKSCEKSTLTKPTVGFENYETAECRIRHSTQLRKRWRGWCVILSDGRFTDAEQHPDGIARSAAELDESGGWRRRDSNPRACSVTTTVSEVLTLKMHGADRRTAPAKPPAQSPGSVAI
jgi:RNA polymerase subunit RPABC4/transcription elongation factor Spt4